jgi:ribose 5-phosphate isomerase B
MIQTTMRHIWDPKKFNQKGVRSKAFPASRAVSRSIHNIVFKELKCYGSSSKHGEGQVSKHIKNFLFIKSIPRLDVCVLSLWDGSNSLDFKNRMEENGRRRKRAAKGVREQEERETVREMVVVVGADHGGVHLKKVIVDFLRGLGHEVNDVGTHTDDPVDYPDYARAVSQEILQKKAERGILICGSGVGACVAANKFPGIRASICHDTYSAHQGVEHDDTNVLCLGARVIGPELAKELVLVWVSASFSKAERHIRRVAKVAQIEREFSK